MATITPQSKGDLFHPLQGQRVRDFCALFNLKTEVNCWGQIKRASAIPAALSAKPNTECLADLRWIEWQGGFPPSLVHDPQEKEINQGSQGFGCLGLLKFYFRVNGKSKLPPLFPLLGIQNFYKKKEQVKK